MAEEFKCFLCDKQGVGWDKQGLMFILKSLKLCKKHEKELTEKLKVMPDPEPEASAWVPKEVPTPKNFTEREAGQEG
jgi:hypothetical protein